MISVPELLTALELGLIYGIVAFGIFITFRVLNFTDLSCDGSFVTGASVAVVSLKLGFSPITASVLAFLAGVFAGLVTGLLNVCFKISDLLAGILVAFMLYSINLMIMGGVPNLTLVFESTLFSHFSNIWVLSLITILLWGVFSLFFKTDLGLAIRVLGQNKRLAQVGGVSVAPLLIVGVAMSNGLIAFAGGLISQHQGFVDISQGVGTLIIGLAAIMIGESLVKSRSMTFLIAACFFGSVLYRIIIAFALHGDVFGIESYHLNLLTGLLVVGIMVLPRVKEMKYA